MVQDSSKAGVAGAPSIADRRPERLIPVKPTPFEVEESDVLSEAKRGEKRWCSSGN